MKTILLLLAVVCLNSCMSEQTYISDGNMNNLIEIGDWDKKDGKVNSVGAWSYLITDDMISSSDFVVDASLSLDKLDKSRVTFYFFGNHFIFNNSKHKEESPFISISQSAGTDPVHGEVIMLTESDKFIAPNEKFRFKAKGQNGKIEFSINDKLVYILENVVDTMGTIGFKPGSGLSIYDFKVRSKFEKQEEINFLFQCDEGGYDTYRIPAVVVTNKGTVLAFCEARKNSFGDAGDIDLVVKRSTDSGKTWSNIQVVWSDGENTCGNPVPVVDKETGKIFLLSTRNLGYDYEWKIIQGKSEDTRRIFVQESDDDGLTWSAAKEITKDVKLPNWTWYATGPCQGIQIQRGEYKGRLVIPCDHIEKGTNKYYSHTIYSDDHGKTWKLGGRTPMDKVNECAVAELDCGDLVLNMRNYHRTAECARQIAISKDGGLTWINQEFDTELIEPRCQAGLHKYSFGDEGKSRLLFTNPANKTKRENMVLRMSYDDGKTWPIYKVLHKSAAAYSDVIRLPNGNIGVFYEAGYIFPYEGIVFESLSLSDLEK